MSDRNLGFVVLIGLFLVGLFVGLVFLLNQFTTVTPGGEAFIPRYVGTRLLIERDLSPYSEITTARIQEAVYGRLALDGEDPQLFRYPIYSALFIAPFTLIEDFAMARAVWMATSLVLVIAIAALSMMTFEWRPQLVSAYGFFVLMFAWFHSVRPILDGNFSILVAALMAGGLFCIYRRYDRWAGILFAFATIKPQMVLLGLILILLWTASRGRWGVWSNFFTTLILLFVGSFIVEPGWFIQFLQQGNAYASGIVITTPGDLFGAWWGASIGLLSGRIVTGIVLLAFGWAVFSTLGKSFINFGWALMFVLSLTPFVGLPTNASNYILLLPGIVLLSETWSRRWKGRAVWVALFNYLLIGGGLWWLYRQSAPGDSIDLQHPFVLFGFPLYMLVMLLFERWWVVRPPVMPIDTVRNALNRL